MKAVCSQLTKIVGNYSLFAIIVISLVSICFLQASSKHQCNVSLFLLSHRRVGFKTLALVRITGSYLHKSG